MMRFEFALPSLAWGVSIGVLIACHRFYNTQNAIASIKLGAVFGFVSGASVWGYNFYAFTMSQHVIRQQSYARQEAALKARFIEDYFKQRYGMEHLEKEQFNMALNDLESKWSKLEQELTESEEANN
ncbi:hypothetical protein SteCoe_23968 [Stentor coeruleus]|uniref:Uncharacterized protein n=1 Tax=Stentor coeruleus TaxID=5963 RepID=A0A1R2BJ37_9CILI|nr:hypothetical protein SteCoe_23968 [Stentor coeruleus]